MTPTSGPIPGADGIPGLAGNPGKVPCLPRSPPALRAASPPRHRRLHFGRGVPAAVPRPPDLNHGGPHSYAGAPSGPSTTALMNGFIAPSSKRRLQPADSRASTRRARATSEGGKPDVMGYHTGADIPNYWAYARDFVLQDHMFESNPPGACPRICTWSRSGRHAAPTRHPMSCRNAGASPRRRSDFRGTDGRAITRPPDYAWTDLTYLLHKYHVPWRYYVFKGDRARL